MVGTGIKRRTLSIDLPSDVADPGATDVDLSSDDPGSNVDDGSNVGSSDVDNDTYSLRI